MLIAIKNKYRQNYDIKRSNCYVCMNNIEVVKNQTEPIPPSQKNTPCRGSFVTFKMTGYPYYVNSQFTHLQTETEFQILRIKQNL